MPPDFKNSVDRHLYYLNLSKRRIILYKNLFFLTPLIFSIILFFLYHPLKSIIGSGFSIAVFSISFLLTLFRTRVLWVSNAEGKSINEDLAEYFREEEKKNAEEIKKMFR